VGNCFGTWSLNRPVAFTQAECGTPILSLRKTIWRSGAQKAHTLKLSWSSSGRMANDLVPTWPFWSIVLIITRRQLLSWRDVTERYNVKTSLTHYKVQLETEIKKTKARELQAPKKSPRTQTWRKVNSFANMSHWNSHTNELESLACRLLHFKTDLDSKQRNYIEKVS